MNTNDTESNGGTSRSWLRRAFGLAVPALICAMIFVGDRRGSEVFASDTCTAAQPGAGDFCASNRCGLCAEGEGDCDPGQCQAGLTCVEEGAVDHCREDECGVPGSGDYCASSRCGPCGEGEGDCDPGQCAAGLTCVEEGAVDHCRPVGGGSSNFQVKVDGVWKGVCCNGGVLEVSDRDCWWDEDERVLTDETAGRRLDCPEGGPTGCECNSSGEPMHGIGGGDLRDFWAPNGAPMYSNEDMETCVRVDDDGELYTDWTSSSCPRFRFD